MVTLKEMINKAGLEVAKYYLDNIRTYISHIIWNFDKKEWETYIDGAYFSEEEWAKIAELKRKVETALEGESITDEEIKEILVFSREIKNMRSIRRIMSGSYFKEEDLIDAHYVFDHINNNPVFKEINVGIKEDYFSCNFCLFQSLLFGLLYKCKNMVGLHYFTYKFREDYEDYVSKGIFIPITFNNVFTTELSSRYAGSEIIGEWLGRVTWWKQVYPNKKLYKSSPYFLSRGLSEFAFNHLGVPTPKWENKIGFTISEVQDHARLDPLSVRTDEKQLKYIMSTFNK